MERNLRELGNKLLIKHSEFHVGLIYIQNIVFKSQSSHICRIIIAHCKIMPVHIQDKISLLHLSVISLTLKALALSTVTTNHP
jgi:hypothetical protein